jgi:hypothetical protein
MQQFGTSPADHVGLGERQASIRLILVEPAIARQQLATARRALLKIATRAVPPAAEGSAVAASLAGRSPARFITERNHVEASPIPMERVDGARDGRRHLTLAPAADGHQATPCASGLSAAHSGAL